MGLVGRAATKIDKLNAGKSTIKISRSHVGNYRKKAESFDFNSWEGRRVRGETKYTHIGLRLLSTREIKDFKKEMHANGIKVKIDKKGMLPDEVAAAFDPSKGHIYLRKDASYLSATHESFHAKQWKELGMEKYQMQTRLDKEEYVYSKIMENSNRYNSKEIHEAQRYIYQVRNGIWPSPDWEGFK
nr:zincin-like metallopeptidase toxin domain-containing protein [Bacillus sp. FJAT-42376]